MRILPRILIPLLAICGCSDTTAPSRREPDARLVTVAPAVRLEYVDYGGSGPPVLLLAGLGHTAHVFSSFAPRLTDRYRVIALTRRGFGASSQPATGYDPGTLATDMRVLMDSLRITRAHLVGHSVAGDEITRFARDFPDRVSKVVYLDGAYDRTALGELIERHPFPDAPAPAPIDLITPATFGRYLAKVRGVTLPDGEVRATWVFGPDGVEREVTPPQVYGSLLGAIEAPQYAAVHAPALSIYAVPLDAGDVLPWLSAGVPGWSEAQQLITSIYLPFYRDERRRFSTALPSARLVELSGASHYVFLSDAARVAREIREFLGTN